MLGQPLTQERHQFRLGHHRAIGLDPGGGHAGQRQLGIGRAGRGEHHEPTPRRQQLHQRVVGAPRDDDIECVGLVALHPVVQVDVESAPTVVGIEPGQHVRQPVDRGKFQYPQRPPGAHGGPVRHGGHGALRRISRGIGHQAGESRVERDRLGAGAFHDPEQRAFREHHPGGGHGRVLQQGGLDLAQLDAVSAHLHLGVLAAEELQVAARPIPRDVAGAVQPLPVDGMGEEPVCGGLRVAEVALRQPGPGDEQLSGSPHRTVLIGLIEYPEALIRERLAVGDAVPALGNAVDAVEVRPDGCLGGTAEPHQLQARQSRLGLRRQRGGNPVPGQQRQPQRGQRTRGLRAEVCQQHL